MAVRRDDRFYTVAEAADELGVSPSTVWRWIDANMLPAQRLGRRRIRIRREDLALVASPARPSPGNPGTRPAAAPDSSDDTLAAAIWIEDGEERVRYFADESEARAFLAERSPADPLSAIGTWRDLDWEEV